MDKIICKDLTIGYSDQVVLSNINFTIKEKEYVLIVGENGSGKTTLVRTLLGLIKPLSGKCSFEGEKKGIAYLPQELNISPTFPANVMEVVLSGFLAKMGVRPFYNKEEKKKAFDLIKAVGLEGLEKKKFKELSLGQERRVLLARTLCADEDIILLDEPASALDYESKIEFYKLIERLNKEGKTIILISHDLDMLDDKCSKYIVINESLKCYSKEEYEKIRGNLR